MKSISSNNKISVIIPAYNREKTIEKSIQSVFQQTFLPYEIIVVDDCSTDQTKNVVLRMKRFSSPVAVRYVRLEKNSGAQIARNEGIKKAKGYWIAFLDSDDIWMREKLESQIRVLEKNDYNPMVCVHGNCLVRLEGEKNEYIWEIPNIDGTDVYATLLQHPGPLFPALLTSKIALEKIGYLDPAVPAYQEWDTAISLSRYCQFIHLKNPLFIYCLHGGETISKSHQRDIKGYQYIIDKFRQEIITKCGFKTWNKHLEVQMNKCIQFQLWEQANEYLDKIKQYSFIDRLLTKMVIIFHGRGKVFLHGYKLVCEEGVLSFLKKLGEKLMKICKKGDLRK